MRLSLPLALAFAMLAACSQSAPVQFVQEENVRAAKYHVLTMQMKEDQAKLNDFVGNWLKVCKVKNEVLAADQYGEPSCAPGQPAAQTPANPTGEQKAVAMKGTVKTEAPSAK